MPEWTAADEFRQFKIAEGVLNSFGITSAIEGATTARDIATLQRLAASGQATLRVGLMFRPEPPAENSAWEAIMRGNGTSSGFGDDWVKLAGIKLFYDGGMTLKTALMRDAYPDSQNDYHGIAQQSPERLKEQRTDPVGPVRARSGSLFNHLVGAPQKSCGDLETQCLGGLEVDDHIHLGGLFNRQIRWPFAL